MAKRYHKDIVKKIRRNLPETKTRNGDGEYTWSRYQFKLQTAERRGDSHAKPIYDMSTYTSTPIDAVKFPDDASLKVEQT